MVLFSYLIAILKVLSIVNTNTAEIANSNYRQFICVLDECPLASSPMAHREGIGVRYNGDLSCHLKG